MKEEIPKHKIEVEMNFPYSKNYFGNCVVISDLQLEQFNVSEELIKRYVEESIYRVIERIMMNGVINTDK